MSRGSYTGNVYLHTKPKPSSLNSKFQVFVFVFVLLESLRSEFPIVLVTVVGGRNERYSTQKLRSDIWLDTL